MSVGYYSEALYKNSKFLIYLLQGTSHEDETGNGLVEEEDDDVIDPLMFIQVIKRVYSQSSAHLSKMTKKVSKYTCSLLLGTWLD